MPQPMITEEKTGDVLVLKVNGKLDAVISPSLEQAACKLISSGSSKLLLDMGDVSYVSSAGLRMLLSIKKQMKAVPGRFVVCNLRSEVLEVLKICGFDHVLDIATTKEEALRQF